MLVVKTPKPKAAPAAEKPKCAARAPREPAVNPVWALLALRVQPKLAVSAPDDPDEQEADRIADCVMRMPDRASGPASGATSIVMPSLTWR